MTRRRAESSGRFDPGVRGLGAPRHERFTTRTRPSFGATAKRIALLAALRETGPSSHIADAVEAGSIGPRSVEKGRGVTRGTVGSLRGGSGGNTPPKQMVPPEGGGGRDSGSA